MYEIRNNPKYFFLENSETKNLRYIGHFHTVWSMQDGQRLVVKNYDLKVADDLPTAFDSALITLISNHIIWPYYMAHITRVQTISRKNGC